MAAEAPLFSSNDEESLAFLKEVIRQDIGAKASKDMNTDKSTGLKA
jgi:hypothetical protein